MIIDLAKNNLKQILELEEKFHNVFLKSDIINDFQNNPYTKYMVYLIDKKIVGFINYHDIYDRVEIINFNVLEFFQNQHIGSSLLLNLITISKEKLKKNITLEVRKDNEKAIYLYKKFGFREISIRKNYYNDVDGILMEKELM